MSIPCIRAWAFLGVLACGAFSSAAACSVVTNTDDGTGGDAGSGSGGEGGGAPGSGGGAGEGGAGGDLPPGAVSCDEPAACGLRECLTADAGNSHVATCSELDPHTNPPTSGSHYSSWAQFGIYDEPFAKGFLMHGLEHSAVALLYNCDLVEAQGDSCDDLVADLEAFYADYPDDPLCTGVPHRLYVIPDPDLDVPFAATAWYGHLRGDCFDADRVRAFVDDHYAQTAENFCSPGVDPFAQGCD